MDILVSRECLDLLDLPVTLELLELLDLLDQEDLLDPMDLLVRMADLVLMVLWVLLVLVDPTDTPDQWVLLDLPVCPDLPALLVVDTMSPDMMSTELISLL